MAHSTELPPGNFRRGHLPEEHSSWQPLVDAIARSLTTNTREI